MARNAESGYKIIETPLAPSSSRVKRGVKPNSVMLARIGFDTAFENFLYSSRVRIASGKIKSAPAAMYA